MYNHFYNLKFSNGWAVGAAKFYLLQRCHLNGMRKVSFLLCRKALVSLGKICIHPLFFVCFIFFFGVLVTRIPYSATSCHLFHLATSQTFGLYLMMSSSLWVRPFFLIALRMLTSPLLYIQLVSDKTLPHLLVLDSFHEVIPTKPIGHVDHMVLHSLIDCTT